MRETQTQKARFIRLREVMDTTGLSRAAIYRGMADKTFPDSYSIGCRSVAWLQSEISIWMEQRIAARRAA